MPVMHVRALEPREPDAVARLFDRLATDVGKALGCEPSEVWTTFSPVERMAVGPDPVEWDGRIVYVEMLMGERPGAATSASLTAAARAVSDVFEVPLEDVWVTLRCVESGRVFAGGEVLEW